MKTLVLISANSEWRAVKPILPTAEIQRSSYGEYFISPLDASTIFFHGGWGKISAAATAQYAIDHFQPDLIVNLGTCGGFEGRIETGTILLVEKTIVYDIIEQMSDGDAAIAYYGSTLDLSWLKQPYPFPVRRGLLVSADRDIVFTDIPLLVDKYGAVAADWESGAIAWVARRNGLKCLILRGVSDLVSVNGGEAYGNIELFHERTAQIMKELVKQLPAWLRGIEMV
jgi:adenosylhomocysteine nucleosidase